jgi:hypothetical protein
VTHSRGAEPAISTSPSTAWTASVERGRHLKAVQPTCQLTANIAVSQVAEDARCCDSHLPRSRRSRREPVGLPSRVPARGHASTAPGLLLRGSSREISGMTWVTRTTTRRRLHRMNWTRRPGRGVEGRVLTAEEAELVLGEQTWQPRPPDPTGLTLTALSDA